MHLIERVNAVPEAADSVPRTAPDSDLKTTPEAAAAAERLAPVVPMRLKGWIVFSALIVYALLITVFVFQQKNLLLRDLDEIQASLRTGAAITQADTAVFHALMAVVINAEATDRQAGVQRIRAHYNLLRERYTDLTKQAPSFPLRLDGAERAIRAAEARPTSANMRVLVAELTSLKDAFAVETERAYRARERLSAQYRTKTDSVAMATLGLAVLGLALLGATTGLFFKRLTEDLRRLQARALAIVRGYRGEPLRVRRHDEVGQLMEAVNSMATALDQHEKELMVERQKYFHQEKMAAIGALAAGVAHEVGNPIAAIAGLAQEISEGTHECGGDGQCNRCRAELIQVQIGRLAGITREISEFAAPTAAEPQLVDLNSQLRATARLMRYDRRVRAVELQLDLDAQLPAIEGVPDQIMQVVMNLLINAVDALESTSDPAALVRVRTHSDGRWVHMEVADNGPGMPDEVRERAFEAFYTTKPAGKGTGLGLSLCYAIMQRHGGSIEIESEAGAGTRVLVRFPLPADL